MANFECTRSRIAGGDNREISDNGGPEQMKTKKNLTQISMTASRANHAAASADHAGKEVGLTLAPSAERIATLQPLIGALASELLAQELPWVSASLRHGLANKHLEHSKAAHSEAVTGRIEPAQPATVVEEPAEVEESTQADVEGEPEAEAGAEPEVEVEPVAIEPEIETVSADASESQVTETQPGAEE
jgi:hypothetical protein